MTNAYLAPAPKLRLLDNNGRPAVGGTVTTYAAGTVTPIATYTDASASTPNTNPVILNFRGECDLWLKPNVAYKLQFNDAAGNLIWTIDNIVNSQLITLYGGVDTGLVNAYVLNFAASFSSYSDGVLIYWIPANTNTGASTINVNGLGVVNITNADGSALVAGEIVANQPATILFKGGAFILVTPATTLYGTFTPSWTGFSASPSGTVSYRKTGSVVTLVFPSSTGTSNANVFFMGNLPALLRPTVSAAISAPIVGLVDNGAQLPGGMAVILGGAASVQFFKDGSSTVWTGSGSKGFMTGVSPTITYTL